MSEQPYDLRKVLAEIKDLPGQYHETDVEIDPNADLAGVYRYIGAGGTVMRPNEGPTMMFNNVKGFPEVVFNWLTSFTPMVATILHHDNKTLGQTTEAVTKPVVPCREQAPAQVVHLASEADF